MLEVSTATSEGTLCIIRRVLPVPSPARHCEEKTHTWALGVQCFYLSLACSFLKHESQSAVSRYALAARYYRISNERSYCFASQAVGETALHFKRLIEAAVLRSHPGMNNILSSLQPSPPYLSISSTPSPAPLFASSPFASSPGSPFLQSSSLIHFTSHPRYPLCWLAQSGPARVLARTCRLSRTSSSSSSGPTHFSPTLRSRFSTRSAGGSRSTKVRRARQNAFQSLYKEAIVAPRHMVDMAAPRIIPGVHYGISADSSTEQQRANLISIFYVPSHYQALIPMIHQRGPTLAEMLKVLDLMGVRFVLTDG